MKPVAESREANMSDMFPIKIGLKQYVLLPLLVSFALGSAFRRDQVKQDGCLEINWYTSTFGLC